MWMITKSSFQLQFQIRNEHITGKVKGISSSHDGNSAKSVVSAGKGLCVHFLTNTFAPMILWEPQNVQAVEWHIISGRVKGWIWKAELFRDVYTNTCRDARTHTQEESQQPNFHIWLKSEPTTYRAKYLEVFKKATENADCGRWGESYVQVSRLLVRQNKHLSFHFSKNILKSSCIECLWTIQKPNIGRTKAAPVSPYNINLVLVVWEIK